MYSELAGLIIFSLIANAVLLFKLEVISYLGFALFVVHKCIALILKRLLSPQNVLALESHVFADFFFLHSSQNALSLKRRLRRQRVLTISGSLVWHRTVQIRFSKDKEMSSSS